MRKLKLQVQISVDGFVAEPDGDEDRVVRGDEKLWPLVNEIAKLKDQDGKVTAVHYQVRCPIARPDLKSER